jgi:phenylacetate-CoA ligase
MLTSYLAYRKLQRSQWWTQDQIRRHQQQKLRKLVEHAYHSVPYYRTLFDQAGIKPADISSLQDLPKIPLTTKRDLQNAGCDAIVSSRFANHRLQEEHTSGSTGQPFTLRFDKHFAQVRNGLFLRALTNAGYRPGQRLMLVTDSQKKASKPWLRWHYASLKDTPEQLYAEALAFRPAVLYGCVTPLRQLALLLQEKNRSLPGLKAVVSTAETLDRPTRQQLMDGFQVGIYDIFGLTEMGMVAWECSAHSGYHLSEDTTITELIATPSSDSQRLVLTNLELSAMPLIRYQTGDLAMPGSRALCVCGRSLTRLDRLEGRLVDLIQLADGQSLSPYQITLAVENICGLRRYQVVQENIDVFSVFFESEESRRQPIENAFCKVMKSLLGQQAMIRLHYCKALNPSPGRKFRVVESQLK